MSQSRRRQSQAKVIAIARQSNVALIWAMTGLTVIVSLLVLAKI